MSFEDDINAQQEAPRPFKDVDVLVNGNLYTFRFTQMDGIEWAMHCDRHPMRLDVLIDRYYGYNVRTMTAAVAPLCGVRLDGEHEIKLRVDKKDPLHPNKPLVDEWRTLFAGMAGASFSKISDTIFNLNQASPQEAVDEAKKALAGSGKTSASPSNSASPRAASGAGSRKK